MAEEAAPECLFTHLIELSRQACETGHYATAYHLLAAALHCAVDARDEAQLAEVEELAHEELDWLETHAPAHHLAPAASARRGSHNLWESLARQARMHRHLL